MKFLKSFISLLVTMLLLCQSSKAEEIRIKHADNLETSKKEIFISGNVKIEYKDAKIEAPQGTIITDENGEQDKAIFSGRAKLKLNDRKIEADKITVSIKTKTIYAEGNTISELKDKKNKSIIISCDFQELHWSGENAKAHGNLTTIYEDTKVISDEVVIIYKNKRPEQALFTSNDKLAHLEQTSNTTNAKEFIFDIKTGNVEAFNSVNSTIWTDSDKTHSEQDPVNLFAEEVYIDNNTGTVAAKSNKSKVNIIYQTTNGKSNEATMLRNKKTNKPEKIIFKGNADVIQEDKQLTSEEVVFNFNDQQLTSNTKTNIRPKTTIFKR